jgi:peptidyl-tRNA hydrolase
MSENNNNEDKIKQVIVIRKDLKMRLGKSCAQASHASMKVFFDRMNKVNTRYLVSDYECYFTEDMESWFNGIFTKICVSECEHD